MAAMEAATHFTTVAPTRIRVLRVRPPTAAIAAATLSTTGDPSRTRVRAATAPAAQTIW